MITVRDLKKEPENKRFEIIDQLDGKEVIALEYDWSFWARPEQLPPEELGKNGKFIWFLKAGRGFGKTRTFAEWVIELVQNKGYKRISLVGSAADEVRDIMIEGESGLMACSPSWFYPLYEPSKKKITWPNGAIANIFYGSEPDKSRGAQSDLIWADELAKWKYPESTFDNLLLGLRLGKNPLCGVSTTPRPTRFIKELTKRKDVIVVNGSTYDNLDNLATPFIQTIIQKYEGTRLGRQELYAVLLDDNPNALWDRETIDKYRIIDKPDCYKMVVAIDPQATSNENSSETGIVVAGEGMALPGMKYMDLPHYYIWEDLSLSGKPEKWSQTGIVGYNKYRCDRIIGERNNGGDMIKSIIHNIDKSIPYSDVWASRGKYTRAEPVSALYEQGRVHHIGTFPELEDQLCEWEPGDKSPDRLDALVWGVTWLAEKFINIAPPDVRKQKGRGISRVSELPT